MALTTSAGALGGFGVTGMLLYFAVIIGIFYFLMIRPQKKKQKQVDEMQSSIKVGDWIMTNGGFYGKVVDVVNNCLMIEFGTNKSVIIPIVKEAVASVGEPDLTRKKAEVVVEEEEDDDDDLLLDDDFLDDDDK